jgi:hypothetical protein
VGLGFGKLEHESESAQRLFDAEESEVVSVSCGELIGSGLQAEREDRDLGAFDILQELRIGAFDGHAGFSSGDDSGGILYPVEDAVVDLLSDIIDGDRGTGIAETATPRRALKSTLKFFEVFEVFVVRFQNQRMRCPGAMRLFRDD